MAETVPEGTARSAAADALTRSVLERLDALPTPSPLAMRLLAAANDDATSARDLVEIIRQDSALTGKVLSLCRRGPRGRQLDVASLDRAVVLLGFAAVRAAALSVEFVSTLGSDAGSSARGFDACRFWRHSLAKAIVAEAAARHAKGGDSGRAFVAGLLHDLGALALSRATPALFDRACEESERCGRPLDVMAESILGLGCAAAGSRLAARWNLPEELQELLRLRGVDSLVASGPHRVTLLLADLADRIVRRRHLGGDGFGPTSAADPDPLLAALGIATGALEPGIEGLFAEVAARAESLGISTATPAAIAAEAIERANRRLESLRTLGQDLRPAGDPVDELDAAGDPIATLGAIVRSISRLVGAGRSRERLLVVGAGIDGMRSEVREFDGDGALIAGRVAGEGDMDGTLAARRWCEMRAKGGHPGSLALACRGQTVASIHRADGDVLPSAALARAPVSLWAFALAASLDRQRAMRAADRAAEAMRALEIARERLIRDRALASVGEIAAGLAHEINNPLTVVSGRAQLLRRSARIEDAAALDQIVDAAERASALVSQLLRTVRPTSPIIRSVPASEIIATAMRSLRITGSFSAGGNGALPGPGGDTDRMVQQASRIVVRAADPAPTTRSAPPACLADPAYVAEALAEVLQNALDAAAEGCIEVSAQTDVLNGRCMIRVRDVGPGFSDRALRHATDPFFSERIAGRGAGLGLAKARSIVESCGGTLELENSPEGGAIVTIALRTSETQPRADSRGEDCSGSCRPRREAA
ncbi:MAG: HDOD domain-containing protein [Phycisphaerae bacterium]|nr:HDOD domain-containing protein [Phycisphaerae bacterium]